MGDVRDEIIDWRDRVVRRVVASKYSDYAGDVVRHLAEPEGTVRPIGALGHESRTSGDSPYRDVWEEFKAQIQGQESIFFDAYEETIRRLCESVVAALSPAERLLLWLGSDAYTSWDDDDGEPDDGWVREGVADELYRHVCSRAADEPLLSDVTEPADDDDESSK